jgi:hypothetical protein
MFLFTRGVPGQKNLFPLAQKLGNFADGHWLSGTAAAFTGTS